MIRIVRVPFLIPTWAAAQVLLPRLILLRRTVTPSAQLIAHELVHVDQIARLGLLRYWTRYVRLLARHGYQQHPMEIEAREAERSEAYQQRAVALLKEARSA